VCAALCHFIILQIYTTKFLAFITRVDSVYFLFYHKVIICRLFLRAFYSDKVNFYVHFVILFYVFFKYDYKILLSKVRWNWKKLLCYFTERVNLKSICNLNSLYKLVIIYLKIPDAILFQKFSGICLFPDYVFFVLIVLF